MIDFPHLKWFPKAFGAGDTDGSGAQRLLGQPDLPIHDLLVRETAQNSWDAALGIQSVPRFQMLYRELSEDVRDVLRWNVFTAAAPDLALDQYLKAPVMGAIEIVDRGTRGLGGPIRNDLDPAPGEVTDYADLVLTIGAPPDHAHGGGTYGFGKTATYMVSRCSTIIIWSRAKDQDGALIERFIASAMGPSFTVDGQKFTGRQWWGTGSHDGSSGVFQPEPAQNEDARRLGSAVFEVGFEGDELGTSILILDPRPSDERDSLPEAWADAVLRNLWPKLGEVQPENRRMDVSVVDRGFAVPISSTGDSPVLDALQRCLTAVRAQQAIGESTDPFVKIEPIWCGRPKTLLGHLALTNVIAVADDDPLRYAVGGVALMRHEAELVVKYQAHPGVSEGVIEWVGVFKPTREVDRAFAASEPPAHDNWAPDGMMNKAEKRLVNVALREIADSVKRFVSRQPAQLATTASGSTGRLSAALAGLAGSMDGNVPPPTAKPGKRGRKPKQPKVKIVGVTPLSPTDEDLLEDRQKSLLKIKVADVQSALVAPSALSLAVDGGTMASKDVKFEEWLGVGKALPGNGIVLTPEDEAFALISYPAGVAVDVNFSVEALP